MSCEEIFNYLSNRFGIWGINGLLLFWFLVLLMVSVASIWVLVKGPRTIRSGLGLGLATAAFANGCWLTLPILGLYPNLLWTVILAPSGYHQDDPVAGLVVQVMNLLFWPLAWVTVLSALARGIEGKNQTRGPRQPRSLASEPSDLRMAPKRGEPPRSPGGA